MNKTTASINRLEFLRQLGLSGSALVAFYCAGALSSCSKNSLTPAAPLTSNITLDLTSATYSGLTTIGGYAYSGSILVAHIKDGSYIALSKVCTHEGSTVQYVAISNNVYCPNHGARFNTTGAVTQGPASHDSV